jgi:tetratricopeptide (TPR) repeat protein
VGSHISLFSVGSAEREADAAEALAIADELRAPALARAARALLGGLLFLRGDWDRALHELSSGVGTRPDETGLTADFTRFALGWLHTARGGLAVGRGWLEEGLARTRLSHSAIWMGAGLAMNLRRGGDEVGARAALAEATAALDAAGCPACGVVFYGIAAEEYAALGERAEAERTAAEAMRLGRTLGRIPARLSAHRALGLLHLDAGRPAAALAELAPALRLCRTIEAPYDCARTDFLAASARLARGASHDRTAARDLLTRAVAAFDRLGATLEAGACRAALAPLVRTARPCPLPPPPRARLGRAV